MEDRLMTQMVDFSTQVRGNILDLVITNMPERVLEVREEGRLGESDHVMIVSEMAVGKEFSTPAWAPWTEGDKKSPRKSAEEGHRYGVWPGRESL